MAKLLWTLVLALVSTYKKRTKEISCSAVSNSLWHHGLLARQAPLAMGFSWQEYWSGLPCSPPGDLPKPREWTWVSCIADRFFTIWTTRKAPKVLASHTLFHCFFFLIYLLLKDNCVTEFCCFLSNHKINQPQVNPIVNCDEYKCSYNFWFLPQTTTIFRLFCVWKNQNKWHRLKKNSSYLNPLKFFLAKETEIVKDTQKNN